LFDIAATIKNAITAIVAALQPSMAFTSPTTDKNNYENHNRTSYNTTNDYYCSSKK